MNNVDVTDKSDEQGVPTYVQTSHSDDFDEYVRPPTIEIVNGGDFIGEKPKVENFVRPVNNLEYANHTELRINTCQTFQMVSEHVI